MNKEQLTRMKSSKGFIAALDQSGGSTPKALLAYGISENAYKNDNEMFSVVHAMRSRIIKSHAFTNEHILGAILFEDTMNKKIDGFYTADFLWEEKGIVPFLKIDKGLADVDGGIQLMKPMPDLDQLLKLAKDRHIFGTKMRSVIKEANDAGIRRIVEQQFAVARKVISYGLVPIIEPEVDIHIKDKEAAELILHKYLWLELKKLNNQDRVIFKLTIPTKVNMYADLMEDERVVRVVALSGGYSLEVANKLLAQNKGLIASFSRALAADLRAQQTDEQFNAVLANVIMDIYNASIA